MSGLTGDHMLNRRKWLGLVLAGAASAVGTAITLNLIALFSGYDPLSVIVKGIIPIGAMASGAAAASGLFFGARHFQIPASKGLAFLMIATAACAQLLTYLFGFIFLKMLGGAPADLGFVQYVDALLTHGREYSTLVPQTDLEEVGGDGYVYAVFEFVGLVVGGAWAFFALMGQPSCPACLSYLETLARKRDSFADEASFGDYYSGEFQHPVGSEAFGRHVSARNAVPFGKSALIKMDTKVVRCPTCGTHSVDQVVTTRVGRDWVEAAGLSRTVDIPASQSAIAAYAGNGAVPATSEAF